MEVVVCALLGAPAGAPASLLTATARDSADPRNTRVPDMAFRIDLRCEFSSKFRLAVVNAWVVSSCVC